MSKSKNEKLYCDKIKPLLGTPLRDNPTNKLGMLFLARLLIKCSSNPRVEAFFALTLLISLIA